ncbi:MAG: GYF domain-containing protein [Chlamydiota bacterium]
MFDDSLWIAWFILIGLGWFNAYCAHRRGRSSVGWFFAGFLGGLMGVLALFLLPNLNKNTKEKNAQPAAPAVDRPLGDYWHFYDSSGKHHGPLTLEEVEKAWIQKNLRGTNYIWSEEMSDWERVENLYPLVAWLKSMSGKAQ